MIPDAEVLRLAAGIMRRRSRKPGGFWLGIFCRILTDTADRIEKNERASF